MRNFCELTESDNVVLSAASFPSVTLAGAHSPGKPSSCLRPERVPVVWEREKAWRLHCWCKAIDAHRAKGIPLRKAVTWFAWYWKNRSWQSAPHVRVRLGRSRLVNLYYRWKANGENPECFLSGYGSRLPAVRVDQVRAFVLGCCAPGVKSVQRALDASGVKGVSPHRLLSRVSNQLREEIKALWQARGQAPAEARKLAKACQAELRRRRAALTRQAVSVARRAEAL